MNAMYAHSSREHVNSFYFFPTLGTINTVSRKGATTILTELR